MTETQQTRRNKRRRSSSATDISDASRPSHLPPDSINPFSRSPGELLQLSIAGLNDTDEDPSLRISDFPHRGLGYSLGDRDVDSEAEADEEPPQQETGPKSGYVTVRERQINVLLQSIHQFLDRGDIAKAARAYGLILQIEPQGKPINLRHYNLWAIGAEILMRDGETPLPAAVSGGTTDAPENKSTTRVRWGSAANMDKVKAYFETLIQQYPYDYMTPQKISSVDFWLAMLSCEIYSAHAEHVISLYRLEEESQDWDEDMDNAMGDDEETWESRQERRESRLNELKDKARKSTLETMKDITGRMENIAHVQPFPKNHSFLKLRATASLYMSDLVMPIAPASSFAEQEGQERRCHEQGIARAALEKVIELGGYLDRTAMIFLGVEDEEAGSPAAPVFSSLPIR